MKRQIYTVLRVDLQSRRAVGHQGPNFVNMESINERPALILVSED